MSGLTGMSLGLQQDRWGKRTPEDTTSFSGKGFAYTSSSLGVFAALAPGRRVVGSSHPPWPQGKGPAGPLLVDVVKRSPSQAADLWHTRSMRRADLLQLSGLCKGIVRDAKHVFRRKVLPMRVPKLCKAWK